MRRLLPAAALLLVLTGLARPGHAQPLPGAATPVLAQDPAGAQVEVSSAVSPDTVTVGDPFHVTLRVQVPAGITPRFANLADTQESFQPLAPARVVRDPAVGGGLVTFDAVYTLAAWRTGALPTPILPIRLMLPDGAERVLRVALPMPGVASVLPADTTGIEARAAKGIITHARGFPWWLVALAALALLAVALLLARRPRAAAPTSVEAAPADPRAAALATLERARTGGFVEAGEWKVFFSLLSGALRGYLAALSPRWDTDLTTEELLQAAREDGSASAHRVPLAHALRLADLVKFARYRPSPAEAEAAWTAAREVIEGLDAASPAEPAALEEVG